MKKLINLLTLAETSIIKLKKTLSEKEECKEKLLLAKQTLSIIANTTCPDHPNCGNAKLLQSIAEDALKKIGN